jgi:short-subunit dehydrogenase
VKSTQVFADRTVMVTGAGAGIGRQFASRLAEEGAAVAAVDLNRETLASLEAELVGKRFEWEVGDVTDRGSLLPAVNELQQRLGPIDLLIANAGIGRETSALSFKAEDIEAQIRVNLIGVANSIESVLPGMIARGHGHIAALSSLASFRGLPKMCGYCASKSGLNAMLEGIRVEVKPHGVKVTTLCPGWISTAMTGNVNVPKPYMMSPEFAVERMLSAIRRGKEFYAFPPVAAWQVRILGLLPVGISDALIGILLRRLLRKESAEQ